MKILAICSIIVAFACSSKAEQATQADKFVGSVGINTHLSYGPLYGDNFPLVFQRLEELGVRHIRQGLVDAKTQAYYDHLTELAQAGIGVLLLTSPNQTTDLITGYLSRAPQSVEAFEAPNEYDLSKHPEWASTIQTFMPALYAALKRDPLTAHMPVVGPSLTRPSSFPALGDQSSYIDFGNMHNYPGGHNPGTRGWGPYNAAGHAYGSILWNLDLGVNSWGEKPVWTTEYGFTNDLRNSQGVPENVSAIYLPRALLEQYLVGIQRTYIFELLGGGPLDDDGFALLHSDTDGTPKPAFIAVRNLLQLLTDEGPAFNPSGAEFSITGGSANVHHVLFEKRDSSFYLLLWDEMPYFDINTKKYIRVPVQNISIHFSRKPESAHFYRLDGTGNMASEGISAKRTIDAVISDGVLVLKFTL